MYYYECFSILNTVNILSPISDLTGLYRVNDGYKGQVCKQYLAMRKRCVQHYSCVRSSSALQGCKQTLQTSCFIITVPQRILQQQNSELVNIGNVDVAKYFGFNSVFYSVYISHIDHLKFYSPARHNNVETNQYNAHVHLQTFSPMDKVPV